MIVNHPLLAHVANRQGALHPFVQGDYLTDAQLRDTKWQIQHLPHNQYVAGSSTDESANNNDIVRRRFRFHPQAGTAGLEGTAAKELEYDAWGSCSLNSWRCASISHYSLFQNLEDGTMDLYGTGIYDFHSNGYSRFSINFLCFMGKDVIDFGPVDQDDEMYLSVWLPEKAKKRKVKS